MRVLAALVFMPLCLGKHTLCSSPPGYFRFIVRLSTTSLSDNVLVGVTSGFVPASPLMGVAPVRRARAAGSLDMIFGLFDNNKKTESAPSASSAGKRLNCESHGPKGLCKIPDVSISIGPLAYCVTYSCYIFPVCMVKMRCSQHVLYD